MTIYLCITRPEQQAFPGLADTPPAPVVLCDRARLAHRWSATYWENSSTGDAPQSWWLCRWQGQAVGWSGPPTLTATHAGFHRTYEPGPMARALADAVWWSERPMPEWVRQAQADALVTCIDAQQALEVCDVG